MNISELRQKWNDNAEAYKTAELGSGIHDFVNDVLSHPELFALKKTPKKAATTQTYVHDTEAGKHGRPDFVLYANKDVTMPCEAKCYTRIEEGIKQLQRYRTDYTKEYGILTDGFTWRFYRSNSYEIWTLDQILENPKLFRTFWETYLTPENYYTEIFQPSGQQVMFEEPIDLNDAENQKIFFKETSQLIARFRTKIKIKDDKTALETSYAYLIQFILYKSLVDNRFVRFENEYKRFKKQIVKAIHDKDLYNLVVFQIRNISEYITQNIYRPFAEEQHAVNEILIADLQRELTIQDIAPWLDIVAFINKFDFSNLQNEIFGFVYENYLKDLYGDNWGQNFTDPAVVDFMLDEMGYTPKELAKDKTKISIIDPACGAGTFLYSAVDRIVEAFEGKGTIAEAAAIKELVDKNVFGLDVAEFPLFLAEMCILLRQLPLIVNELYNDPVEKKLKLFKTRDSISEFLDTGITAQKTPVDLLSQVQAMALDYKSFMRNDENLLEMLNSMQSNGQERLRFDYVAANPPYIGYNDCCRQGIEFTRRIKNPKDTSITLGNVFGVNLHSVPGNSKKYPPKPNVYAFFIALGLGLLKDNGKLCYIIPQTLLTETDYDVLRYYLSENITIEKIITVEGNLFVKRGLRQKKTIATSSLIIILRKKIASQKHKVKIINYKPYSGKESVDIAEYLRSRNKSSKAVLQSELRKHYLNWNFIKHEETFRHFQAEYNQCTEPLGLYFNHKTALSHFRSQFIFDVGYILEKQHIAQEKSSNDYELIHFEKERFQLENAIGYYPDDSKKIKLPKNSQGLGSLTPKYKIVWQKSYGTKRFHFSERRVILNMSDQQFIASENKRELLYLMSLLNSTVNTVLFQKLFSVSNEKLGIFIVIKRIKEFIRIPLITAKNQKLKDKVIALTESMLALESVTLRDIVDFARLNVQKFDTIYVEKNELVLSNGKEFRLKITDGNSKLVQKVIQEKYKDGTAQSIVLTELKSLSAIDFDRQNAIKQEIDDLVFALYFDVPVKNVAKHKFYAYVKS